METCPTSGGKPCSGVPHATSTSVSVLAAHAGVTITLKFSLVLNRAQSDRLTGLEPPQISPRRGQGGGNRQGEEAIGKDTGCQGTLPHNHCSPRYLCDTVCRPAWPPLMSLESPKSHHDAGRGGNG